MRACMHALFFFLESPSPALQRYRDSLQYCWSGLMRQTSNCPRFLLEERHAEAAAKADPTKRSPSRQLWSCFGPDPGPGAELTMLCKPLSCQRLPSDLTTICSVAKGPTSSFLYVGDPAETRIRVRLDDCRPGPAPVCASPFSARRRRLMVGYTSKHPAGKGDGGSLADTYM